MAQIPSLYGRIALQAPGAPTLIVRAALLDAIQEFCRRTRCWREAFSVEVDAREELAYRVSLPRGVAAIEPVEVKLGGHPVNKDVVRVTDDEELTVIDNPSLHGTLEGLLAVEPTDDADEIPNQIMREHREALVNGALARLLRMPRVDWSNPGLGEQRHAEFEHAIDAAEYRAADGYMKGKARSVRYGGY
jgi:hypothetical protein